MRKSTINSLQNGGQPKYIDKTRGTNSSHLQLLKLNNDEEKSGDRIQNAENSRPVNAKVPSSCEFWYVFRNTFSEGTHFIFFNNRVGNAFLHFVAVRKQLFEIFPYGVAPQNHSEDSNLNRAVKQESQDLQDSPRKST
jgi:hypothetical protein